MDVGYTKYGGLAIRGNRSLEGDLMIKDDFRSSAGDLEQFY